jgi:hypothetical protein
MRNRREDEHPIKPNAKAPACRPQVSGAALALGDPAHLIDALLDEDVGELAMHRFLRETLVERRST